MTMGPGGDLKLKLHIDTSAVADDLLAIDKEVQRLEQRLVAAFNRGGLVRKGRVPRATSIEDVGKYNDSWTPEVKAIQRQLGARIQQVERAARGGETRPPLTPAQQARSEAQERLKAASRPTEITAKQKFFDDMVTSLRRGLGSTSAMAAAQTGIPGASRVARTLMGLVEADPILAGALGGAAVLGGGAFAIQARQAGFQRQQAALASALVGGPAFGDTRTMLGLGVMAAAQQMDTSQGEGAAIAQQLAGAGMRPGQVTGNLQNVLALTKAYGIGQPDATALVGALGTAGGQSFGDIGRTVRDLVDASSSATGSLAQLTSGLKVLSDVNATAGRDAFGLAAVQRAVGPTSGINAGQLMAPAMGAFGTQALGLAGLLGISPEQLVQMQKSKGGQAQLYDLEAGFMRTMSHDVTGQELGLQILSDVGGLDISKLPSDQKLQQARRMQTQRPGQTFADYQRAAHATRTKHVPIKKLIDANTPWQDTIGITLGNAWTRQVTKPGGVAELAYKAFEVVSGNPLFAIQAPPPWAKQPDAWAQAQREVNAHNAAAAGRVGSGGGKLGLHMVPAGLVSQVAAAATGAGRSGDATHTVKIEVTVKDQRGNTLGHKVDTTRVIAGASTTNRPPYDHPGRSSPPPWTGGGSSGGHGGGGGSSGFD